jgi:hypothetical protein
MCCRLWVRPQALFVGMIVVVDPGPKPEHTANNERDAERNQ